MFIVSGTYVIRPGKRDEFMNKIYDNRIIDRIRREDGNISYDYFYPCADSSEVYFLEQWESRELWQAHCRAPHVTGELKALKDTYMTSFRPGLLGYLE